MLNLRVVTYNIHQGITVKRSGIDLTHLKKALLSLSPDLVFLQEVAGSDVLKKSKLWPEEMNGQLEALADEMWPHSAFFKNVIFSKHHHGNAILSKFPFIELNNENITVGKFKKRGVVHGRIAVPFADGFIEIHVLNAHLGLLQFERELQVARLCNYVNQVATPKAPLLIAGDFNDWRKKVTQDLSEKLHMDEVFLNQEAKYARTFPSRFPLLNLDRIYFRKLELKSATILKGKPWTRLSDHLPIMADFRLVKKK